MSQSGRGEALLLAPLSLGAKGIVYYSLLRVFFPNLSRAQLVGLTLARLLVGIAVFFIFGESAHDLFENLSHVFPGKGMLGFTIGPAITSAVIGWGVISIILFLGPFRISPRRVLARKVLAFYVLAVALSVTANLVFAGLGLYNMGC